MTAASQSLMVREYDLQKNSPNIQTLCRQRAIVNHLPWLPSSSAMQLYPFLQHNVLGMGSILIFVLLGGMIMLRV
ncbi:hypothetical protein [Candidatus Coxiella mudrowiae]|uniref:hypothetical protein n=1 Tax=Candidatus Coxiella mudrowiae TaxID=2054173 RepID=UPI0012FEAA78|nr:hypothetical protein [Candidatus Coxiella mudrowiae]